MATPGRSRRASPRLRGSPGQATTSSLEGHHRHGSGRSNRHAGREAQEVILGAGTIQPPPQFDQRGNIATLEARLPLVCTFHEAALHRRRSPPVGLPQTPAQTVSIK